MPATTIEAVMQMRRGLENDLDISQLRIGEWALSTDRKWVRICYAEGKVIKIASQEAMDETLAEIQEIEDAILVMKNAAAASALAASGSATTAGTKAEDAEAWAVGKRNGVDVPSTDPAYNNNSKYWAQHAVQSLDNLTDTDISNPSNNDVLKYNSTSGMWENGVGGGSGSGGHTIENASGTDLTQRDTLQFKGTLKASDDSTNEKTIITDEAEEIEWSVWNAMTEAEQDAYSAGKKLDILHAPSVSDNKAPKTDIATVESGSTASRAYSIGELVYVNGNLYKVITAIASGATFTVGTNIQSTNVSERIRGGWTTVSTTIGTCTYNDDWIMYDIINAASVNITTAWSSVTIDTLPIKPRIGARSTGVLKTSNSSLEGGAEINLDVNGAVRVTSYANPIQDNIVPIVRSYVMHR